MAFFFFIYIHAQQPQNAAAFYSVVNAADAGYLDLIRKSSNYFNSIMVVDESVRSSLSYLSMSLYMTKKESIAVLLAGYSYFPENKWGIVVYTEMSTINAQLNIQIRQILLYSLLPFILLMLATMIAEVKSEYLYSFNRNH